MLTKLRYGIDSTLQLELPEQTLVANLDAPRGRPLADPGLALRESLRAPLDFPPLAKSVIPGDRVAIALDHGVPRAAELVAGIVAELVEAGIEPGNITVVQTAIDAANHVRDPRSLLPENWQKSVQLQTHEPSNRDQLRYLAATGDAKPIYVNSGIVEADLVVPVGVARVDSSLGYPGPASGVFPAFSDEHTAERYRAPRLLDSPERREKLRALSDEVSWLLGVMFAVQVVPAGGDDLLHIVAGRSDLVFERSQSLCDEAWSFSVPQRASLVVAAVPGANGCQTWENVARAVWAASQSVTDDGAIVLCTDLAAELGPGTQRLRNADDRQGVLREISRERPVDALVAAELAHALERGPLYLLSQLDEALVEDLGIASVADEAELERLVSHHDSCILLGNAQHAVAIPAEEA